MAGSDDEEPIAFKRSPMQANHGANGTKAAAAAPRPSAKPPPSHSPAAAGKPPPAPASTAAGGADSDDEPIGKTIAAKAPPGAAEAQKKRPADSQGAPKEGTAKKAKPSAPVAAAQAKPPAPKLKPPPPPPAKVEDDSEDDVPLSTKTTVVAQTEKRVTTTKTTNLKNDRVVTKRSVQVATTKVEAKGKGKGGGGSEPGGGGGGPKWTTLEHSGVIFPPPYTPHGVKMLYEGKPVSLTPEQEEVATMFAVMRETEYVTKQTFLKNFWQDWKKVLGPKHVIQSLDKCDFTPIWEWQLAEKEKKKNVSAEQKKRMKEEKMAQEDKYMYAFVDNVKEKVGNFRVEPPGLFRGRGEHPKMGKLKKRVFPEDIVINIGKGAKVPECPMAGHRWKEIRHDNTVTWLAYWMDPINNKEFKYVFLAASSSLKGASDKEKYEKARKLKEFISSIRQTYTKNFYAKDAHDRQIAVATYLIDRLALRAGNEKDEDEADTVGCCSLKVEHVTLVPPSSLQFDFLGKDSIRYFNTVEVEPKVYEAVGTFQKGKKKDDDLFDRLDTTKLNTHLKNIMPGLTAKVFRTYNASITLDTLLQDTVGNAATEKVADYQRANKEVAILCNHQRTVSKAHAGQMEKLELKLKEASTLLLELEEDLSRAKKGKPPAKSEDGTVKRAQSVDTLEKKVAQTKEKLKKLKLDMAVKDDLKTVALGTSKINYLDPRITVAWCKSHDVPIEKIFNKSLLAKFSWAMDVPPDFRF